MDSLENVRFPSVGDSVEVDEVTVSVVLRNSSDLDSNVGESIAHGGESDHAVSEFGPLFELPLHLDPLVLLQRDILSNNGASEEHELSTFFLLRDGLSLRHLTESHLVSHGIINNVFWDIPGGRDFSSLRHD